MSEEEKKQCRHVNLTMVDGLMVLLSLILVYGANRNLAGVECRPFVAVEPFLMVYWLFRLLFGLSYKLTSCLLFLFLLAFCIRELYLGYSQLFQYLGTGKAQEVCVGSFSNSGPLGCFLSMCSILFVDVWVRAENRVVRTVMAVLVSASFILMACTLSRAAILSFMVGLFALALKTAKYRILIKRYWVYIVVALALAASGAYMLKKPSADGRFLMARIGWSMIRNGGLTGVGLGNFEGAYGEAQAEFFSNYLNDESDLTDIGNIPENMRMVADCPAYAFNEYLLMGIECGPIAMIVMIGLFIAGIWSAYSRGNSWCYPLIAVAVFACFSYPFEVDILLLITFILLASNGLEGDICGCNLIFMGLMIVSLGTITDIREKEMGQYNGTIVRDRFKDLCRSRSKWYIVTDCTFPDGLYEKNIVFTYGQSLSNEGRYAKSDSLLTLGTKMSSDPMFWNVMGNNSMEQGHYREAEESYRHAFCMVPNRIYPLTLLAKLYHAEGDTARFLKMAGVVETFIPKVESVNTERLRSEIVNLKEEYIR